MTSRFEADNELISVWLWHLVFDNIRVADVRNIST